MQWYYLDGQGEQKPFDENYLAALTADNRIGPDTQVWSESLDTWKPAAHVFSASFPGIAISTSGDTDGPGRSAGVPQQSTGPQDAGPAPAASSQASTGGVSRRGGLEVKNEKLREMVKDFASYINAQRGWLKFMGVILIIGGVLNALTIVGLLIAWLPIWSGVLLLKAAGSANLAETSGSTESMADCLYRLGQFFKINGIMILVLMVIYVVIILFAFLSYGAALLTLPTGSLEEFTIPPQ